MADTPAATARDAKDRISRAEMPGAPPGTLIPELGARRPVVQMIGYGSEGAEEGSVHNARDLSPIQDFLERYPVTWVNVDGLADTDLVRSIGKMFGIHPLVLEDVVHPHQRAKVDSYGDYLYIVTRMVDAREHLDTEQLSLILGKRYVITFQEGVPGDCLQPVRDRIKRGQGHLRSSGSGYLAYALLDAVVDNYFPVLEGYHLLLERFEDQILAGTRTHVVKKVHGIKRDLITLHRSLVPLRNSLQALLRDSFPWFEDSTRIYLRDVDDHSRQLLDLVDSYRKIASDLIDLQLSLASNRMNDVMKLLTVIGSIFLPLTFITGLYGMNFDTRAEYNLPELRWEYGYVFSLGVMAVVTLGMLIFFYRKGWLSLGKD